MTRLTQTKRGLIGYVYKTRNESDFSRPKKMNENVNMSGDGMQGDGLMDKIKLLMGAYSSPLGTALRNSIPDSDNTATNGFAGEKHMILKLKNGKNGVANFMGPQTQVIERVKRGDVGRTPADNTAKMHDIQYVLAGNSRDKASQFKKIRAADNRMINSLKKIQSARLDAPRNVQAGMRLIQLKKAGEDYGFIDKQRFSGPLNKLADGDSVLLNSAESQMEQMGYGIHPADKLKQRILKHMARKKKKSLKGGSIVIRGSSNGQSKSKKIAKSYKMSGDGIQSIVKKRVIPKIVNVLGLPKNTVNDLNRVATKILQLSNNKGMVNIVKNLTKGMLPLIVQKHLKGNGIMYGNGKIIKMVPTKLHKLLAKAIINELKMGGRGMGGGNFFKDFGRGFKLIFKPSSKVLGAALTATGNPVAGVALSALGGIL